MQSESVSSVGHRIISRLIHCYGAVAKGTESQGGVTF